MEPGPQFLESLWVMTPTFGVMGGRVESGDNLRFGSPARAPPPRCPAGLPQKHSRASIHPPALGIRTSLYPPALDIRASIYPPRTRRRPIPRGPPLDAPAPIRSPPVSTPTPMRPRRRENTRPPRIAPRVGPTPATHRCAHPSARALQHSQRKAHIKLTQFEYRESMKIATSILQCN